MIDDSVEKVNVVGENLMISSKLSGILAMTYDESNKTIRVIENPWR